MDADNLAVIGEKKKQKLLSLVRNQHQVEVPQKIRPLILDIHTDGSPRNNSKFCCDLVIEERKTAKEPALMTGINIRPASTLHQAIR
jgi:hypothetical protein